MVPETIDGYRVVDLIGRGGNGRVYRVTDSDGQVRAIKTFRDREDMTQLDEQRFEREFQMARMLVHPNIVPVFGWGQMRGTPYFTMEYVSGGHLREFYQRKQGAGSHWWRDPALRHELLSVVDGILAGLAYIHANRIVHRDLKPENILLTAEGVPKIMDFGLARPLEASVRLTTEHTLLGTVAYMSPEQVASAEVDPRSDLYSLGVVLFEWLSGRLPYDAEVLPALLGNILTLPAPDLHVLDPAISPSISRYIAHLLQKDPVLRWDSAEGARQAWHEAVQGVSVVIAEPTPVVVVPALFEPVFVGRDAEMGVLMGALEGCSTGHNSLVVLAGESGVGKSRLALELSRAAALRNIATVTSRCYEELDVPFEAFLPMLRTLLKDIWIAPFVDAARPVLAAILPELSGPTMGGEGPTDKHRLFQTILELCHRIRDHRPAVLVFDDLQWGDPRSLELLAYLAHELLSLRAEPDLAGLLLVVMAREEEMGPDHPLNVLLDRLEQSVKFPRLHLQRLPETTTERMAVSMLGGRPLPPGLLDLLQRETEGNPFFVGEFLKVLLQDQVLAYRENRWQLESQAMVRWGPQVDSRGTVTPMTIRDVIRRRLRRLAPATLETLRLAAVAGRDMPWELLSKCNAQDENQFLSSLETLLNEHLMVEIRQRHALAFYHPQIREVVLEDMPEARRRTLHLKVARGLEEYSGQNLTQHLFELAHHFYEAREGPQAAHYMLLAAEQAKAAYSYEEALQTLIRIEAMSRDRTGLDAVVMQDVRRQLAHVTLLKGDFREAIRLYEVLAPGLRGPQQAEALRNLGRAWDFLGEHEQAFKCYHNALEALGETIKVRRSGSIMAALREVIRSDRATGRKSLPAELGKMRELRKLYDLMLQSYYYTWGDDRRMLATELAIRHLKVSLALEEPASIAQAYLTSGFLLLHIATLKESIWRSSLGSDTQAQLRKTAHEYLQRALQGLDSVPDSPLRARILREAAWTYLSSGDVRTALPLFESAHTLSVRLNDVLALPISAVMLANAHYLMGNFQRCRDEALEGLKLARPMHNTTMAVYLTVRLARCSLLVGDVPAAHDWMSQARRLALPGWRAESYQRLRMGTLEADLMRAEGRLDQAVLLLEQIRTAFRRDGFSLLDTMNCHIEAGMAWLDLLDKGAARGECLPAVEAIVADARSLADGPLLKGGSLMLLGRLRAAQERPDEARRRLTRAIFLFREIGSPLLTARCLIEAGRAVQHDAWLQEGTDIAQEHGYISLLFRARGAIVQTALSF